MVDSMLMSPLLHTLPASENTSYQYGMTNEKFSKVAFYGFEWILSPFRDYLVQNKG